MKLITALILSVTALTAQAGESVHVPTDSKAYYEMLLKKHINGRLLVVTKRVGPSGTSFAAREIDCQAGTFRYVGEGSSIESLMANVHDKDRMAVLTAGSISTYVAIHACKG